MMAVIEAKPDTPALVISLDGNQIVRKSLMESVEKVSCASLPIHTHTGAVTSL